MDSSVSTHKSSIGFQCTFVGTRSETGSEIGCKLEQQVWSSWSSQAKLLIEANDV